MWRRNSDKGWVWTEDPNDVLAKPNSKPKAKAQTEILVPAMPVLATQPHVISNPEGKDIDHKVINHLSEMADTFKKLLSEMNEISEAIDEKICKAEESSAA